MADQRGRSAQEREAARLERERRRAEREAQPAPEEPAISAGDGDGPPEMDGQGPTGPAAEEEQHDGHPSDEREIPLGIRRVAQRHRLPSDGQDAETPGQPRPRRRPRRPQGQPRRPRRPQGARLRPGQGGGERPHRSWVGRVLSVVAIALGALLLWFLIELFQPFHGQGRGEVAVTIAPHSGAAQIGDELQRDGVISSSFFFNLRATLSGDRGNLLAGTYTLKQDMSYGDVLRVLSTPPTAAKVTNVTLIEGRTRRQIDGLLRSQGIHGSYLAQTRSSALLDPRRYGAPAGTRSLEGFLFPSTYQLRDPIKISALIADQLTAFRRRFASVDLRYAAGRHLTAYDVLIIASMVQAEAQTARDGPRVAAVIYNRLAAGMPLQIDATTRYATGNYSRPLTVSELNSPSPYNTRSRKGLPPTPIDNPGLAAIQAAAHPSRAGYLYFVVKPCGNGEQVFTSSYSQFLADAQQYQAARARRGGHSPAHC